MSVCLSVCLHLVKKYNSFFYIITSLKVHVHVCHCECKSEVQRLSGGGGMEVGQREKREAVYFVPVH